MNAKSWARLERLAEQCAAALRHPGQQSVVIWRGDMWAILGAHHDLRKAREKADTLRPAPPSPPVPGGKE